MSNQMVLVDSHSVQLLIAFCRLPSNIVPDFMNLVSQPKVIKYCCKAISRSCMSDTDYRVLTTEILVVL